nr:hypothetical protein [Tanacetum cinerariifolium]
MEHKLNEYSHIKPIKKRRSLGHDRSTTTCKEVEEFTRAGILREAAHQTWVANPFMVKKSDEGWRMKRSLLLPKDALQFKNAGATYERLVDKELVKLEKSGRVAKWAIELGEHDIMFRAFLIEAPPEDNRKEVGKKTDTKLEETKPSCECKLYTDGASIIDGSGARLMLIDPEVYMEIINIIEKKLTQSQQGWVDDLPQVLWIHKTLPRNNQKDTPFSLTYGSKATISTVKSNVAKDDKGRTKEVTKRKESKEVASIEEAYYQNKLRMYYNKRSNHSIYKVGDFVLLLQNNVENPKVWQGPHMIREVHKGELYKIIDTSDHLLIQTSNGTNLRKFYM